MQQCLVVRGTGGEAGGVTVTLPSSQSSSVAQLRWVGVKSLTVARPALTPGGFSLTD